MNLRFLPHHRKNSEMRQGGQESKVRIYLNKNTVRGRAGRQVRNCCPGLLWKAGYEGLTNEGAEYSLGKEEFGGRSP